MEHHLAGKIGSTITLPAARYRVRPLRKLVASPFFSFGVRADLQTLYDVQAALREISDTPHFVDETRDFLLDCLEQTLDGQLPEGGHEPTEFTLSALKMFHVCQSGRLEMQWAQRLVQATRRDISRPTSASWSDLMLYCRYAAEPLGRAALQLHEVNDPAVEQATDALTAALLVLRLVRRAGSDWRLHGRCHLPTDWFAEEGGSTEQLVERQMSPAVKRVITRVLDRTQDLLIQAKPLPHLLTQPRLRAEAVRLLKHADYQLAQLRRKDPLRKRLKTSSFQRIKAYLRGWWLAK